jgi:outer membrane protein assembly factor BamE (lipoprotein component of BamABCDE complex)
MAVYSLEWMEENTAEAKLNKIESGMSTKEVQNILGRPAQGPLGEKPGAGQVHWNFQEAGVAYVYFDSDGKATTKGWVEHYSNNSNRGLMGLIRDWLGKLGL